MGYKNLVDLHIHTDNSDDGFDPVSLMGEYAVKSNLVVAAITDHCECNRYKNDGFDKTIRQSFDISIEEKEKLKDKIKLIAGMELGQAMQALPEAEDALAARDYDFVIGSLHNVAGEEDFWKVDYKSRNAGKLLHRYYDEILELLEWGQFDTLAHINYPLRYIIGVEHIDLNLAEYESQIDDVLKLVVSKNKALEVNTSGLRQPYGKLIPDVDILSRFKELGGKYVTIGSDAHHYYDVGAGITEGLDAIKQAGFENITYFENRTPVLLKIE